MPQILHYSAAVGSMVLSIVLRAASLLTTVATLADASQGMPRSRLDSI
ncbi:UNVERIFIED_CONTAM: hypothetical protein GTU68_042933 [Idotea baltica]|nr:hypothetical protein [Idotea baltica]